jgi:hypothetical protein
MSVCIGGEHIAQPIQSNKPMYFLNWVQLSYDFGKVVTSGTTQRKVCCLDLMVTPLPTPRIYIDNDINFAITTLGTPLCFF